MRATVQSLRFAARGSCSVVLRRLVLSACVGVLLCGVGFGQGAGVQRAGIGEVDSSLYTGKLASPESERLQRELAAEVEPVGRTILRLRLAQAEAEAQLAARKSQLHEKRNEYGLESERLAQARVDLLRRAHYLATVADCQDLLSYIRSQQKTLAAAEEQSARDIEELDEEIKLKAVQRHRLTGVSSTAAAGNLHGLPPLEQWGAEQQEEFSATIARLEAVLGQELNVLGSLKASADSRLSVVRDSVGLLHDKSDDVVALKDQLFWRREPVPYGIGTVRDALDDLGALARGAVDIAVGLPQALTGVAGQMGDWRLLGQCVAAVALVLIGMALGAVWVRRIRPGVIAAIEARLSRPLSFSSRLAILLLRCVQGEAWFWLLSAPVAAAWLSFVTLQEAYLRAAGMADTAAGLNPGRLAMATVLAYAVVAGYRLARRAADRALNVKWGQERPTPLPDRLARHALRSTKLLLLAGLVMLAPIAVLDSMGYDAAFVSLLWQALRCMVFVGILWAVARRGLLDRLFGERRTALARLAYKVLRIVYPATVLSVLFLILFRSIGFAAMSRSIVFVTVEGALGLSLIVLAGWRGGALLKKWHGLLGDMTHERPWLSPLAHLLRFGQALSALAGVVLGALFLVSLLRYHYWTAIFSPHAPAFVRNTAQACRGWVGTGGKWACRPIYGESGMTPLSLLLGVAIVLIVVLCSGALRRVLNQRILARTGMDYSARHTLSAVIVYLVVGLAILVGLNVSGLPLAGLGIFAGASGLAIGFGMQAIISNFVSGLIIMIERHVKAGDCVKVGDDLIGFVERINARSTTVQTFDNYRVIIPNSAFIEQQVINWSTQDPKLRVLVEVGIAYGSDVDSARKGLLKVAAENELVMADPAPEVRFWSFGNSSLTFQLLAWVPEVGKYYQTISSLHFDIDREFRERGIEIAFPQQDLHVRSVDPGALSSLAAPPVAFPPAPAGPTAPQDEDASSR